MLFCTFGRPMFPNCNLVFSKSWEVFRNISQLFEKTSTPGYEGLGESRPHSGEGLYKYN